MAKKDARIRFLERELAEREKEMGTMIETEQPVESGGEDERVRDLERKVRELEALVRGLTAEVLDLKSVTMNLCRDVEERKKKPVVIEERTAGATVRAEPRARSSPRPAEPAVEEEEMDLIMQNDGTLKPEPRRSTEYIVASTKFENAPMKGRGGKKSERTLFVEQKKRKVGDVIQAEEGDTLDLDR